MRAVRRWGSLSAACTLPNREGPHTRKVQRGIGNFRDRILQRFHAPARQHLLCAISPASRLSLTTAPLNCVPQLFIGGGTSQCVLDAMSEGMENLVSILHAHSCSEIPAPPFRPSLHTRAAFLR